MNLCCITNRILLFKREIMAETVFGEGLAKRLKQVSRINSQETPAGSNKAKEINVYSVGVRGIGKGRA